MRLLPSLMSCWRDVKMLRGRMHFPPGMNGAAMSFLASTGRDPACPTACLLRTFPIKVLMHLLSSFCFLFLALPCSLFLLSQLLCMLVPLPALFGLFISMAPISMESSHSDKHIRLNIGLCRKRRNCFSCFLPSRMIYAWLSERERGRWLSPHESWRWHCRTKEQSTLP